LKSKSQPGYFLIQVKMVTLLQFQQDEIHRATFINLSQGHQAKARKENYKS